MIKLRPSVLKTWTQLLSWKMQAVLIQGLRAPDTHYCEKVKYVCRWMRAVVYKNADKNHTFMCEKNELPKWEELEHELNYCSVHYATHFLYALQIIGYEHPGKETREKAFYYYEGLVKYIMHFNLETKEEMGNRLADVEDIGYVDDVDTLIDFEEKRVCPPKAQDRYVSSRRR